MRSANWRKIIYWFIRGEDKIMHNYIEIRSLPKHIVSVFFLALMAIIIALSINSCSVFRSAPEIDLTKHDVDIYFKNRMMFPYHYCDFVYIIDNKVIIESYKIYKGDMVWKIKSRNEKISNSVMIGDSLIITNKIIFSTKQTYNKNVPLTEKQAGEYLNWDKDYTRISNRERLNVCRNASYIWKEQDNYCNNIKNEIDGEFNTGYYHKLCRALDFKLPPNEFVRNLNIGIENYISMRNN